MKTKFRHLFFFAGLAATMIACANAPVGGVRFPEPSPGFTPQKTYNVTRGNLVNVIDNVCMDARIMISSQTEAKIVTDYIQGQTENMIGGMGGTITTRYMYTLQLRKIDTKKTKLVIYCKLESSGGAANAPWHDISGDNPEVVSALEKWLYEQIEMRL